MGLAKVSIAALGLVGGASAALQPIVMKGTKFFYENGTQFYMKGIAYQEDVAAGGQGTISDSDSNTDYKDPLSDKKKCDRDIPNLVDLGINTIRTYAINPDLDHDYCMEKLDKAGIYVISDLSQPKLSINRDDAHWDTDLFDRYKGVVDSLADYSNVIGFFGGNEVSNNASNTDASAYVKAAIRDTKKHIKDTKKRWLGVGYASNDDKDIRSEIAHYFNCGDSESSIDYWGYNIYSWCGDSDMETSGYDKQVEFFSNYSVPVFFAEYGCNNQKGGADARTWTDTDALYTDAMTGVFSGGIVYMYFNETNDYGVVQVKGDDAIIMDNFEPLAKAHKSAKPKTIDIDDYKPENSRPASCPAVSDTWKVNSEALPPVPDASLCECMVKSRECVPSNDLEAEDFGDLFGFVCGADVDGMKDACRAINGEPEVGVYGAYSMCTPKQKLAYVLDAYYKNTNKASDSCKHDGAAKLQTAETESSCRDKLSAADDHNKEVAKAPTADEASSGSGSGSGSGNSGSDEDPGSFGIRSAPVSLYMALAMGAGAVMAML